MVERKDDGIKYLIDFFEGTDQGKVLEGYLGYADMLRKAQEYQRKSDAKKVPNPRDPEVKLLIYKEEGRN